MKNPLPEVLAVHGGNDDWLAIGPPDPHASLIADMIQDANAAISGGAYFTDQQIAIANELVKRWNCHAKLLAACKAAEKAMAKAVAIRVNLTGITTGANADILKQIQEAIAEAERP